MRTFLKAIAVLALAALAGCAADSESPQARTPPDEASAPRELVARWQQTLAAGDKAPYMACFAGSKDDLVVALAVFEAVQAGYAFQNAVVSTYGPEAWKLFEAPDGAHVDIFPKDPQWARTVTVVPMGQAAFAYTPRGRVPLHLVQDGGGWHVQAAGLVPPGVEARRAADYLFRWAAALRGLIPKIGQKQLAAEKARVSFDADFNARLAPADRPAAAAAVRHMLMQ